MIYRRRFLLPLTTLAILACGLAGMASLVAAEPALNAPPEGYRALFNGKDLAGWRGMGTENPYKLAAKTEAERAAFFAANQPGIDAHWKVVDGVLVNDGQGPYLTTIEDFGDVKSPEGGAGFFRARPTGKGPSQAFSCRREED